MAFVGTAGEGSDEIGRKSGDFKGKKKLGQLEQKNGTVLERRG
jgi:hypothetical protein